MSSLYRIRYLGGKASVYFQQKQLMQWSAFVIQTRRIECFIHTVFKQSVNICLRKAKLMILIFAQFERTGVMEVYHIKQQNHSWGSAAISVPLTSQNKLSWINCALPNDAVGLRVIQMWQNQTAFLYRTYV